MNGLAHLKVLFGWSAKSLGLGSLPGLGLGVSLVSRLDQRIGSLTIETPRSCWSYDYTAGLFEPCQLHAIKVSVWALGILRLSLKLQCHTNSSCTLTTSE